MAQCEYWFSTASEEFCDLAVDTCKCGGNDVRCTLKGKTISTALEEEERMTLDDTALRARKRRSEKMAG